MYINTWRWYFYTTVSQLGGSAEIPPFSRYHLGAPSADWGRYAQTGGTPYAVVVAVAVSHVAVYGVQRRALIYATLTLL